MKITESLLRKLEAQVKNEEISHSRMVEILNETAFNYDTRDLVQVTLDLWRKHANSIVSLESEDEPIYAMDFSSFSIAMTNYAQLHRPVKTVPELTDEEIEFAEVYNPFLDYEKNVFEEGVTAGMRYYRDQIRSSINKEEQK